MGAEGDAVAKLGRRLFTIPLYALVCVLALASAPLWIPGALLVDLLRRRLAGKAAVR